LDHLFVAPENQRNGIGSSLLMAVLDRMPHGVTLTVFEENRPARQFYEKRGFRETGRFLNEKAGAIELAYATDNYRALPKAEQEP
jgi:ribosomal protein S18 acetylase RimI-like enzyme